MQNKGFVRVFAILLTLVCVFYLSFSFVTRHYTSKAKEFAKGDVKVEQDYLDSLANEKVYFGNWTLKQCREMEISLGLGLMKFPYPLSSMYWLRTRLTKHSTKHWSLPPNKLPQARMT